jgi:hypothetical protein
VFCVRFVRCSRERRREGQYHPSLPERDTPHLSPTLINTPTSALYTLTPASQNTCTVLTLLLNDFRPPLIGLKRYAAYVGPGWTKRRTGTHSPESDPGPDQRTTMNRVAVRGSIRIHTPTRLSLPDPQVCNLDRSTYPHDHSRQPMTCMTLT